MRVDALAAPARTVAAMAGESGRRRDTPLHAEPSATAGVGAPEVAAADVPPLAPGTAPGWYDDPSSPDSGRRYWDGAGWLDPKAGAAKAREPITLLPKAGPWRYVAGFLGVALIAYVVVVIAAALSGTGSPTGDSADNGDVFGAIAVCEDFVSNGLTSPGSAEFQSADDANVSTSGDRYTYRAYVDSQNGFGALLRTEFECEVEHTTDDRYQLIRLDLNGENVFRRRAPGSGSAASPPAAAPSDTPTSYRPDFPLDDVDPSGVSNEPPGLLCRDLADRGYAYPDAVAYWVIEGEPDRMDEDLDRIPCETVFPPADVDSYWDIGAGD